MDENTLKLKRTVLTLDLKLYNDVKVLKYRAKTTTNVSLSQYFELNVYTVLYCSPDSIPENPASVRNKILTPSLKMGIWRDNGILMAQEIITGRL